MFTFTGDPYSRGVQHGRERAEQIRRRLAQQPRLPVQPWIAATAVAAPHLVQEMEGIAAGAGTPFEDIFRLNCFEAFDLVEMVERGGCTAVVYAAEGRTVAAQNWDANAELAAGLAVHLQRDPQRPDVVVLASPGGLGWIGMNEHGVALVTNDLMGGTTALTAPSQVIRRLLLEERSAEDALARALSVLHPALRSYLLADGSGQLISLEARAGGEAAVARSGSVLTHTNHAKTTPGRDAEDAELQRRVYPSSAHRDTRAATLAQDLPSGTGALPRLLADHDGHPLSICRHESADEATITAASVIFDCTGRRADFALGYACRPESRDSVRFEGDPRVPQLRDL
ncbi:C45 family autoproteolytic acyltransferase/hydolase [Cryptosporangium sp. NPDC051539]|uniref:C45 family autoproteolytic acyltransferase/hydolase n=1 Tax=Cryptosporangium sp. NPDC051539 TaxID=3363962 RepID=UPI0037943669